MTQILPDNRPILVGAAAIQQKTTDLGESREALALMIDAAQQALADSGSSELGKHVQLVSIPKGMWDYSNPSALVAKAIGAEHCTSELANFGILQQTNIGKACLQIEAGEIQAAIVAGGEAKFRALQAQIQGIEVTSTPQTDSEPDRFLQPQAELWSEIEANAGLGMPVGYYALLESAICAERGNDMDSHRDAIADMYARFSEIAAENPDGWLDSPIDAKTIRDAGPKNKMLAHPYAKYHNSQWNVDQACALVLCSAGLARKLGIPEENWVLPLASVESNQMVNVSQRPNLAQSAAASIGGAKALELGSTSIDALDFIELYSCFPAAVNLYINALDLTPNRDLTVTGAMPFAGGPLNNYFLQSTVKLVQLVRSKPGSKGLATCVSGMFTKQGYGVWQSASDDALANDPGFGFADVTEEVAAAEVPLPLKAPEAGDVDIVAATVLYEGTEPGRAIIVGEYADGTRTVAASTDAKTIDSILASNPVGDKANIAGDGQFAIDPAR